MCECTGACVYEWQCHTRNMRQSEQERKAIDTPKNWMWKCSKGGANGDDREKKMNEQTKWKNSDMKIYICVNVISTECMSSVSMVYVYGNSNKH